MNRKFQVYALSILLVIVVLALFLSEGFGFGEVNDFEDCVRAGNPIMESYPRQCRHSGVTYVEDIGSDLDEYFSLELYEQAIENNDGRIPIEGFDPWLYKGAFPGFLDSDFHNARAVGGVWIYDGELVWVEDNPKGLKTSADGTLTDKGLQTVLDNLQSRLGVEVNSKVDVDQIISLINIHKCKADERLAEFCIALYDPVCGWNDPDKVQCVRYPCAETYSNGCEACKSENILYWTHGECPA